MKIKIMKRERKIIEGRPVDNEVLFYSPWIIEILDLIGTELYQALQTKLENTIIFKIRYSKKLEELRDKKNFTVKFKERTYDIYQVDFMGFKKDFIKLKCKEVL